MRYVLKKGLKVEKYNCPACGQIEMLSEDEKPVCSNCGTEMGIYQQVVRREKVTCPHVINVPDATLSDKVLDLDEEKQATPVLNQEIQPQRKKPGRPPKPKKGTCSTCATAMRAVKGYTCKIDCTAKREDDSCSLWIEGEPID